MPAGYCALLLLMQLVVAYIANSNKLEQKLFTYMCVG